ncbi:MAG: glycoside hydrolase family 3 protein [Pyrinomonadaceae bacterium]|nr:glycoside hydrolase family 3 protein [Pyrinomonadaceae bacterium]
MKNLFILLALLIFASRQTAFAQTQKVDKNQSKTVEETLAKMTLREKIGQMIVMPLSGEFANVNSARFKEMRRQITELKVGGFTLFRGEANSIAVLTNGAQRLAKIPLFFSADYERGLRMQLRTGTPFTTNMGVAAAGDVQAAYNQGKIICEEMRAIGANWLFAPVADVNNNPDNPVINIRSFGADPKRVGEFVAAEVRGVREANCLATLKHFPGHGNTATDSHIGLSVISANRAELNATEIAPFKKTIDAGVDAIMTAHLAVPNVTGDNLPSTLNPKIINDILRKDLKFDGIISTDSMEMGAITKAYPNGASAVSAIKAGVDVVLFPPNVDAAISAIEAAVVSGEITEERLNESVERLLNAKYRIGLFTNRFVDLTAANTAIEKPENIAEAMRVAEKSITLLRNEADFLPLSKESARKTLFVIIAADDDSIEGATLTIEIAKRQPNAKILKLDFRSNADDYAKVSAAAKTYDSIILAPFVKRAAAKGTVALPENQAAFVKILLALDSKKVGVVAFGNPYMIRQFPEAKTYAVTYAIEEVAQTAAARVMFGEVRFQGKLPVTIPNLFEIGAGITR